MGEGDRPYTHISRMCAMSIGENYKADKLADMSGRRDQPDRPGPKAMAVFRNALASNDTNPLSKSWPHHQKCDSKGVFKRKNARFAVTPLVNNATFPRFASLPGIICHFNAYRSASTKETMFIYCLTLMINNCAVIPPRHKG